MDGQKLENYENAGVPHIAELNGGGKKAMVSVDQMRKQSNWTEHYICRVEVERIRLGFKSQVSHLLVGTSLSRVSMFSSVKWHGRHSGGYN